MRILNLVLAESALETVPPEIAHHNVIVRDAKRRGKDPTRLILDRARHHAAMKTLPNAHKRGRPDIVYLTLQVTQYTPLNTSGMLRTYVHTIRDYVLVIDPRTRIPHNYNNFIGLMEQLFEIGQVPPQGEPLIKLEKMSLRDLILKINPDTVILLDDVRGEKITFRDLIDIILKFDRPCVIIGGFPHGEFSVETYSLASKIVKIGEYRYNTFLIVAKLLTYLENALGLEH